MPDTAPPIDISQNPELLSLAQEIKRSGMPRLLRANGEELVRVSPIRTGRRSVKGKPTSADDPFWRLIAMGQTGEAGDDASERDDEILAAFELESQA